jgi:hypothetical protein
VIFAVVVALTGALFYGLLSAAEAFAQPAPKGSPPPQSAGCYPYCGNAPPPPPPPPPPPTDHVVEKSTGTCPDNTALDAKGNCAPVTQTPKETPSTDQGTTQPPTTDDNKPSKPKLPKGDILKLQP